MMTRLMWLPRRTEKPTRCGLSAETLWKQLVTLTYRDGAQAKVSAIFSNHPRGDQNTGSVWNGGKQSDIPAQANEVNLEEDITRKRPEYSREGETRAAFPRCIRHRRSCQTGRETTDGGSEPAPIGSHTAMPMGNCV